MRMYFFWTACLVLTVVPVVFVWNAVYKDGIVGRIALLTIAFVAAMFVLDPFFGDAKYDVPPLGVAMACAFAIFLLWHLWRFHRRVLRRGACPPDCPMDRRHTPDRRYSAAER